jgi:hypothetical protein
VVQLASITKSTGSVSFFDETGSNAITEVSLTPVNGAATAQIKIRGESACVTPDDISVVMTCADGLTATENLTVSASTGVVMRLVVKNGAGAEVPAALVEVDGRGTYASGQTLAFAPGASVAYRARVTTAVPDISVAGSTL